MIFSIISSKDDWVAKAWEQVKKKGIVGVPNSQNSLMIENVREGEFFKGNCILYQ